MAQAAEQAFAERAAALLDAQSQEMARRAEGAIATWSERLQPALGRPPASRPLRAWRRRSKTG